METPTDRAPLRSAYVKDHIVAFTLSIGGLIGGLFLLSIPGTIDPTVIGRSSWIADGVKVAWAAGWLIGSAGMVAGMVRLRADLESGGCFLIAGVYALALVASLQVRGPASAFVGVIFISALAVGHFLRGIFVYQAFRRGRALVWAVNHVQEADAQGP